MSTVVNSNQLLSLFHQLGWDVQPNDLLQAALGSGIPAERIVSYLSALAANPAGMDDSTIAGCDASTAASLTGFLKQRGLVGT